MQIHRIHDEHQPLPNGGGPHRTPHANEKSGTVNTSQDESREDSMRPEALDVAVAPLLDQLRSLSEASDDALKLAQRRLSSGELFTREAAESVATSLLNDFLF